MKATEGFKAVINDHLLSLANTDALFAETLNKPGKKIEDCITYILNKVQKSGQNGFADDEIFGMAVHYYDEDDIEVGKAVNARVVVNHHVDAPVKVASPAVTVTQSTASLVKKPALKKAEPANQIALF
jgi:hypothetical protein